MFDVDYAPPARNYFKKLKEKPLKKLFHEAIILIRQNPDIGEAKTGDLTGIMGYDIFYKGTNYEIAYRVEQASDGSLIVIIMAGSRENFYEQLKRYMK